MGVLLEYKWPERPDYDRDLIDEMFGTTPHSFEEGESCARIEELVAHKQVAVNSIQRAGDMAHRADRLVAWLCWSHLKGEAIIRHPHAEDTIIPDPIPHGQRPTVAVPWTDHENADVIADIQSIEQDFTARGVHWPLKVIGGSVTFIEMLGCRKLRDRFDVKEDIHHFAPGLEDVEKLLGQNTEFMVYDRGYRDEFTGEYEKFLPNGTLLFVAATHWLVPVSDPDSDDIYMERIGEVLDDTRFLGSVIEDKQRYLKAKRTVLPQVKHPECLVRMQVMP